MALIACDECGAEISDQAHSCPSCGKPYRSHFGGWEYKSERKLWGVPLIHITAGINPQTGMPRVARGIIASGPVAFGVVSFGGFSCGLFSFGGLSLGLVALGGVALGLLLAMGGLAIGTVALGGCAIGLYSLGGMAMGAHPLGSNIRDAEAIEFFSKYFGSWVEQMTGSK